MFPVFQPSIPWIDVIRRTIKEVDDDNCLGLAAQLAFYFLLGLFPALLFLVALIAYVPVENVLDELLSAVSTVAPSELVVLLREQLDDVARGGHASLLTLGILGAIWSSSAAMVAIIDALNRAYDVAEWRPWWKRRLVAIGLTLALALFTVMSLIMLLIGPGLAEWGASWFGLAPVVVVVWAVVRWPVMIVGVIIAMDLIYRFAPNRREPWVSVTPGACLATVLWILSSFGFKFYLVNFGNYASTYGAIGGAIVTMLWFYVSGLAILIGAELNGVIEHARREHADRSAPRFT
jgi:membrane protein